MFLIDMQQNLSVKACIPYVVANRHKRVADTGKRSSYL